MAAQYVVVLTTLPAEADSQAFAVALVEERMAACVNLLPPMESVYRWEGQIERQSERLLVIKTSAGRVAALRDRVEQLHPYDVPEFIVLPIVDGSARYLGWIGEMTE